MCESDRLAAFLIHDLNKSLLAVTGGYGQKAENCCEEA